jgi:hypothetical protein
MLKARPYKKHLIIIVIVEDKMIVEFKYYIHDNYSSYELKEYLQDELDMEISEELVRKMDKPFYEVTLHCSLDTETGQVTLLEAQL